MSKLTEGRADRLQAIIESITKADVVAYHSADEKFLWCIDRLELSARASDADAWVESLESKLDGFQRMEEDNNSFLATGFFAKRVTIKRNVDEEYEVPTDTPRTPASSFEAGLYFTDDKDDAMATAKRSWGDSVQIVVRRGTYQ